MKKMFLYFAGAALLWSCAQPPKEEATPAPEPKRVDFAEAKYIEMAQANMKMLAEGNVDGFINDFADNAVFLWNNGDSLASKQAIHDFWTERRGKVVDTITYTKEAWLAIQANDPPPHIPKGVYVFNWATYTVKYTTGKSMTQSLHHVTHFDANNKIDRMIQYIDRVPIAAALAKK